MNVEGTRVGDTGQAPDTKQSQAVPASNLGSTPGGSVPLSTPVGYTQVSSDPCLRISRIEFCDPSVEDEAWGDPGKLRCLRLSTEPPEETFSRERCRRQQLAREGADIDTIIKLLKVKESYRKKGKKEREVTNFEALAKEIEEKKREYMSGADKYPDAAARRSAEYRQAL